MGNLNHFQIQLTENKLIYHAGERVKGQVFIHLSSSMQIKTLDLKFVGKAKAGWSGGTTESREVYSAKQMLFEENLVLLGGETDNRTELPKGQHIFSFDYQLPSVLPSSFKGDFGSIVYFVSSKIDKPWKLNHTTKKVFTVLDTLDLNKIPNMLRTSGCSGIKQTCCWRCTSGPIEVECQVERTGYIPGDYVTFNASSTNSSNNNIAKTSVELVRTTTYLARRHTKQVDKTINQVFGPGVSPHDTMLWIDGRIQIPPLPPSDSTHCNIIQISYSIQIQVHLHTFALNLKAKSPIVIGTIPLRGLRSYSDSPPEYPGLQRDDSQTPPPSYAIATSRNLDIREEDDHDTREEEASQIRDEENLEDHQEDSDIDWEYWGLSQFEIPGFCNNQADTAL